MNKKFNAKQLTLLGLMTALCDVRALVRARLRPVPDEVLEPRAHHVLAVPHRQHSLLCRRHCARVYF